MRHVRNVAVHNRLLSAMPSASFERLLPELDRVSLRRGATIDRVDGPIEHLFFVNRGFVSVVKTMRDGRSVEVGGIGVEGLTDANSLFGINTAVLDTIVQIPGEAFQVRREALQAQLAGDGALRQLVQTYARFGFSQIAQTAACNRLHSLAQRCCRWLLIAHDSALADNFPLTHEFLAMMLGSQRSGVSIAANQLRDAGLIDYTRGRVTVLDRRGLEAAACECYATIQHELDHLIPPAGNG